MTKLSFIVPVYNVAPYLRKCVDSLLAQDYDDYEIILVDDGSTDESGAICDEYAASSLSAVDTSLFSEADHSIIPIRVLHQANAGLSAARNSGIKVANGEYICFVDSDDYWESNVLGGLLEQAEREKLDVLRFDYQNVRLVDKKYEAFQPYKTPHKVDMSSEIVDGETYLNTRMGYACYVWQFVARREIVPVFIEGIHFEDVEWLPRMMLKARRVGNTQTVVYNYFWREGSITLTQGNKEKIQRNLDDRMTIIAKYNEMCQQNSTSIWLRRMQSTIVAGVLTTIAREYYEAREGYINHLFKFNVFPICIADQGRTYVRRARIINLFGPRVYCLLMHLR